MSSAVSDSLNKLAASPRSRIKPLVPEPFDRLETFSWFDKIAKSTLRFCPVVDVALYQSTLTTQQIQDIDQRASKLYRRSEAMRNLKASEFSWEACAWHDVFGLILNDEWFKVDKRKYKYVEKDGDGNKIVKTRIPDATFGLTTYDNHAINANQEFEAAGYQADYSNKQPDDRLSQERLKTMTHNPLCGLVVDGVWGEADIVFPFAVYEAKKRVEDYLDAAKQIKHACQIYLSMLDDLARDPDNVAEYQDKRSRPCQMFAFVSNGSQWSVYVVWSSSDTCNIQTLWHGDIIFPDNALKLICLVDQIHDYAILHHRPTVLKHLDSWLAWSEKPEHNRNSAWRESLKAEHKFWWALEAEMSQMRKKKLRQAREQKAELDESGETNQIRREVLHQAREQNKKLDEPARVTRSRAKRGAEQSTETASDGILNGRVTKRVTRKQERRTRKSREAE